MNLLNKNIEHLKNFGKYLLERLFGIILIIAVILGVTYLFFSNVQINNPKEIESQAILINGITLDNLSIWLGIIGIISTAIWALYQFEKSRIASQQEKASEIAQDFANNIIERMGLICDVLVANQDIQKMISQIDTSKLNQFTVMEMLEIINDKKCFQNFEIIVNSKRTQKRYNKILKNRYNKSERDRFDSFFPLLIENTLNKLEAICINISSQAAGSQFIYESLHQMFLSTIELLSIKISGSNTNNVDKYYVNIISVYNMWNLQKQKDIDKLNKTNQKMLKFQKKAENEIKKLLNKQTKTV